MLYRVKYLQLLLVVENFELLREPFYRIILKIYIFSSAMFRSSKTNKMPWSRREPSLEVMHLQHNLKEKM